MFLDGVVPYTLGCTHTDVNCTSANCTATAQPNATALEAEWAELYVAWFAALKAKHPKLLWVNNLLDQLEPALLPVSNGRMYEGPAAGGLNQVYSGAITISQRVALSRKWATGGAQPNYIHLSMNSAISGGWRVGRWQNLVTRGEMMRAMTDFRRLRFGLGVTLMTDSYFANDIGGGWYGVPSHYAEYEAELGQAIADPVRVFAAGDEEVWTREFEHGFVAVSSIAASNFTLSSLPSGLRQLPLSRQPARIVDQREAPAWQFVIDNSLPAAPDKQLEARVDRWTPECVCSAAAPACCPKAAGRPQDWWADDSRRAGFQILAGNWTTVTDTEQSHQVISLSLTLGICLLPLAE